MKKLDIKFYEFLKYDYVKNVSEILQRNISTF